jgi:hypothetical protein
VLSFYVSCYPSIHKSVKHIIWEVSTASVTNVLTAGSPKTSIEITGRIQSIELFRGLVMIPLQLDRVRQYFHSVMR